MTNTIDNTAELMRVLGESTRLRLAFVLAEYSLSVAELTELTGLAQSRISSHLARMRRLDLLQEERQGTANLQALSHPLPAPTRELLTLLRQNLACDEMARDLEAAAALVRRREQKQGWAARVAGEMEKHYSPGRGWEVSAKAFAQLLRLGDVLDIAAGDGVVAGLLAPQAKEVTCVDRDSTVARAGRKRLAQQGAHNTRYLQTDMHALPFAEQSFDTVLLMHALTYSEAPERTLAEAARVLRPGGRLVLATLDQHQHQASVAAFDHKNNGFSLAALQKLLDEAQLRSTTADAQQIQEGRPPFHVVHVITATK